MTGWPAATIAAGASAAAMVLSMLAIVATLQNGPGPVEIGLAVVVFVSLSIPLVGYAAVRGQPRSPIGWLLLVVGITLPVAVAAHVVVRVTPTPWLAWLDSWPWTPAATLIPLVIIQLFPDGRPLSRRWTWVLWVGIAVFALQLINGMLAPVPLDQHIPNPVGLPGIASDIANAFGATIVLVPLIATLSAIVVQLRRRLAVGAERATLTLVAIAAWAVAVSWWWCLAISVATGDSEQALFAELAGLLAVAVAAWVGIRRFGLFDARTVVSRGIAAVALGVTVVAIYLAVAWAVAAIAAAALSGPIAALVAVAAALPLYGALSRASIRVLFGDRNDPAKALRRLSDQIGTAADPERLLPDAMNAIKEGLRLPGVELVAGDVHVGEISAGAQAEEFPLYFAAERVGELRAALRDPGEAFSARDRAILTDLAAQLAGAARAVGLIADLRRSRERLVSERESERRRITRDLHDGLGARLGGLVLGLQRARRVVATDTEAAGTQLDELTAEVRDALDEVRRLVYELRPPALDELGLGPAVEEHARRLTRVEVILSEPLGALPAAVEVAAYRIVVEAMTNIARHASPGGTVRMERTRAGLLLEVADLGPGIPDGFRAGVGISSMRERAAELDGEFSITTRDGGGTLVRAVLPIGEP